MQAPRRFTGMTAVAAVFALLPTAAAGGATSPRSSEQAPGSEAVTRIRVAHQPTALSVPPHMVGANHRWPAAGLGMWDAANNRPDPTITAMSKRVGLGVVRYPGGTVANLFDWKKAIGPADERGCQVGGGFVGGAEPKDSVYGPDEHQRYVAAVGATTNIMMPAAVQRADDAADWVEYMNAPVGTNPNGGRAWAKTRAENGHPEPYGVRLWEVGNEPYHMNQRYWRSDDRATALHQYAFGGSERQIGQPVGTKCDHRPTAALGDGAPDQTFTVHYAPVVPDSQTIYVDGTAWRKTADLSTARPNEAVYEFDARSGAIRFGDGRHGRVPDEGLQVTADYTSGPHPGFVDYYRAMKEVDPDIDVCAAWAYPEFVELIGDDHPYDCIAPHLYAKPDKRGAAEELHDRLVNAGPDTAKRLDDLSAALHAHRPDGPRPFFAVTEYGTLGGGPGEGPEGWQGSVMHSLYLADVVAGMAERDVRHAEISNLNLDRPTTGNLFGGAPDFYYTTRAHLLELVGRLAGSRPVASDVRGNPTATGDGGYRALRALATRSSDGTVNVFVINRDRERPVTARIHIEDLVGEARATVRTLNGPDITSHNSAETPDVVGVSVVEDAVESPDFAHRFPAHSVTLIQLDPTQ